MANQENDISLSALKITLIYLVVAALWIAFTDQLLNSVVTDPDYLSTVQTYKGWIYVTLTSLGLLYLIKRHDRQIAKKEEEISELSERVKLEKELSDILFERIPVLINIYDPDLDEFRINKEFEKVTGWTNQEVQEMNFMEACFPDLELRREVAEFMEKPGIGWKEFPINTKSGEQLPTSWTNIKLTDDTSVGIGIDMTEIKASQAKIRESQQLLQKTFESLKSSLILVDPENRTIIDCNKATEEIFGYDREELIDHSTRMLHVSEKSYQEFDDNGKKALEEDGVFQTQHKMKKKDGTTFHSDHTVTLVYDEDGEVSWVVSVIRDITEQKEYEQKLEQRQKRLMRSQEIGKIGDWRFNIETEVSNWSKMLYQVFERDPELGPPSFDALLQNYFAEDSKKLADAMQRAAHKGQPYDIDLQLKTDKDNEKHIRAIGIPKKDESGEIVALRGIVQDITQRKQSQKKLEQRKSFIETTLENLPIGVAVNTIDDGKVTLMNEQFTNIYGWPREILTDVDSFFEHVYPDEEYRAIIKERVMTDMESGNPEQMQWQRISVTTQEGEERIVNNRAIPVYDQDLMISTVIDVTEQERLKEELELQNRTLEEAQAIAQMGYWEYNIGGDEPPVWSDNLYQIYGLDPEEFEPTIDTFLEMIHPDDKPEFDEFIEEIIQKESIQDTFRVAKPNGQTGYYHSRNDLIKDREGNPSQILGIVHDITEVKRMEEKVIQSVIEGEDRERKRIALELHDGLGQYLVAANMNFQSVQDEINNLSDKREKQFQTGLSHLTKALSETRSIAYNLMPKAITDYGLIIALQNLIEDLRKSTEIGFTFDSNCQQLQLANSAEINIYRILQEIISNAVKHAECSQISITLEKTNDNLQLSVKDDGKGAELDKTNKEQGLGLHSIKTRVKSLNGSLNIESEPEKGMKIVISIPNIDSLNQNREAS